MVDYAKTNLRELEDQAKAFGLAPALEARFARSALESESLGLSLQRLAPDARQPFGHRHREQDELYVVVDGGGRIALGDEVVDLATWDAVRVPAGTMRCLEAGPDGLEFLAFGAGEGGLADVESVPGWAGRLS